MNSDFPVDFDTPRWQGVQRRIGLTGGIASGKSSVAHFLEQRVGFSILDADVYARQALGPGTPLTEAVVDRYGKDVLDTTKFNSITLDRFALARIIFSDVAERLWLEELVHPFVRNCFNYDLLERKNLSVVVLVIPLLFEANFSDLCSEIWLVDCDVDQQAHRLSKRDHMSLSEAHLRIKTQWPMERKKSFSDFIIDNSGSRHSWMPTVLSLVQGSL